MKRTVFLAFVALIEQRWPFPEDAKQARDDWMAELWAKVVDWHGDRVKEFKRAVNEIVADRARYGRPNPDAIVATARSNLGMDGQDVKRAQMERGTSLLAEYKAAMDQDRSVIALRDAGYRPSDAIMALSPSDRAVAADHVILNGALADNKPKFLYDTLAAARVGAPLPDPERYAEQPDHKKRVLDATRDFLEGKK